MLGANLSWWPAHPDAGGTLHFFRVALKNNGPTSCLLAGTPTVTSEPRGTTVTARPINGSYSADRPIQPGEVASFSLYTNGQCNGLPKTRGNVVVTWPRARGRLHMMIPALRPVCSLLVSRFYVQPQPSRPGT
jgi:Protein of unknown function (DUF4232)